MECKKGRQRRDWGVKGRMSGKRGKGKRELGAERRESTGCMEDFLKRKKEREEKRGEKEKEEVIFRRSEKIERSPERKIEKGGDIKKWKEEMWFAMGEGS